MVKIQNIERDASVRPALALTLGASSGISIPGCVSPDELRSLQLEWTFEPTANFSLSDSGRTIHLEPNALRAGTDYDVKVSAQSDATYESRPVGLATDVIRISALQSELVVAIDGGDDRRVPEGTALTLDAASSSHDPDTGRRLEHFTWYCDPYAEPGEPPNESLGGCEALGPALANASRGLLIAHIGPPALRAGSAVRLRVRGYAGNRSAEAATILRVSPSETPAVGMSVGVNAARGVVNPAERLVFEVSLESALCDGALTPAVSATDDTDPACVVELRWQVMIVADGAFGALGSGRRRLEVLEVLDLDGARRESDPGLPKLILRPWSLKGGSTYLIELTATSTSTGAVGESARIVRVNLPPSGGVLVASPPSGAPFGSPVELVASNFDDDDQPLRYRFGCLDASGSYFPLGEEQLSSHTSASSLVVGNVTLIVEAIDAHGGVRNVTLAYFVDPPFHNDAEVLEDYVIHEAEMLLTGENSGLLSTSEKYGMLNAYISLLNPTEDPVQGAGGGDEPPTSVLGAAGSSAHSAIIDVLDTVVTEALDEDSSAESRRQAAQTLNAASEHSGEGSERSLRQMANMSFILAGLLGAGLSSSEDAENEASVQVSTVSNLLEAAEASGDDQSAQTALDAARTLGSTLGSLTEAGGDAHTITTTDITITLEADDGKEEECFAIEGEVHCFVCKQSVDWAQVCVPSDNILASGSTNTLRSSLLAFGGHQSNQLVNLSESGGAIGLVGGLVRFATPGAQIVLDVNGQTLDLSGLESPRGVVRLKRRSIEFVTTCDGDDDCRSDSAEGDELSRGKCTERPSGRRQCDCPTPWGGARCQRRLECQTFLDSGEWSAGAGICELQTETSNSSDLVCHCSSLNYPVGVLLQDIAVSGESLQNLLVSISLEAFASGQWVNEPIFLLLASIDAAFLLLIISSCLVSNERKRNEIIAQSIAASAAMEKQLAVSEARRAKLAARQRVKGAAGADSKLRASAPAFASTMNWLGRTWQQMRAAHKLVRCFGIVYTSGQDPALVLTGAQKIAVLANIVLFKLLCSAFVIREPCTDCKLTSGEILERTSDCEELGGTPMYPRYASLTALLAAGAGLLSLPATILLDVTFARVQRARALAQREAIAQDIDVGHASMLDALRCFVAARLGRAPSKEARETETCKAPSSVPRPLERSATQRARIAEMVHSAVPGARGREGRTVAGRSASADAPMGDGLLLGRINRLSALAAAVRRRRRRAGGASVAPAYAPGSEDSSPRHDGVESPPLPPVPRATATQAGPGDAVEGRLQLPGGRGPTGRLSIALPSSRQRRSRPLTETSAAESSQVATQRISVMPRTLEMKRHSIWRGSNSRDFSSTRYCDGGSNRMPPQPISQPGSSKTLAPMPPPISQPGSSKTLAPLPPPNSSPPSTTPPPSPPPSLAPPRSLPFLTPPPSTLPRNPLPPSSTPSCTGPLPATPPRVISSIHPGMSEAKLARIAEDASGHGGRSSIHSGMSEVQLALIAAGVDMRGGRSSIHPGMPEWELARIAAGAGVRGGRSSIHSGMSEVQLALIAAGVDMRALENDSAPALSEESLERSAAMQHKEAPSERKLIPLQPFPMQPETACTMSPAAVALRTNLSQTLAAGPRRLSVAAPAAPDATKAMVADAAEQPPQSQPQSQPQPRRSGGFGRWRARSRVGTSDKVAGSREVSEAEVAARAALRHAHLLQNSAWSLVLSLSLIATVGSLILFLNKQSRGEDCMAENELFTEWLQVVGISLALGWVLDVVAIVVRFNFVALARKCINVKSPRYLAIERIVMAILSALT